jgi:predicted GH43/DUF377 family glycosyl hydrolase
MKKLLIIFSLISLMATWVYAQLPFESFAAHSGNPVVSATQGSWDQSVVAWASVVFMNDSFYLTYIGTNNFPTTPVSIGLAVSSDGFSFQKSESNPILSGDGSGFDAFSADGGTLFFDNSVWYLYYAGLSIGPSQPANVIGRATSNASPHGPWTRNNDTLLTVGSSGEWDSEFMIPLCIVKNGLELVMYYWAGSYWPGPAQIGMATSTNSGTIWQKYNNPATITPPYVESDPVLKPDKPYDIYSIYGCCVLKKGTGWEMLYSGATNTVASICYATSVDGINWVKDDLNNPIFIPSQDPIAVDVFEKPAVVFFDNKYFMYYDYGANPNGIGLATANIVSVEDEESIPNAFALQQNYPNPFNPSTKISWQSPVGSWQTLKVYDVLGNEVATLVNEYRPAGKYKTELNAANLPSGIYFYQIQAGSYVNTKKMILLK